MTSMPLFPYLEIILYLNNISLKPFQETLLSSSSSSSSPPLSKIYAYNWYGGYCVFARWVDVESNFSREFTHFPLQGVPRA